MRTTKNLADQKFGKWEVKERDWSRTSNAYWICSCECGHRQSVNGSHLRRGKSLSCRKCSENKHKGKLCSRLWHRMLRRAKVYEIPVDMGDSKDARRFLYELLHVKQKGICALSGLPIMIANTIRGDQVGETTASLDRIDSSKGYSRDNVQWTHKLVNKMKWNLEEAKFVELCRAVADHHTAY